MALLIIEVVHCLFSEKSEQTQADVEIVKFEQGVVVDACCTGSEMGTILLSLAQNILQ